jgi:hypothetical protein
LFAIGPDGSLVCDHCDATYVLQKRTCPTCRNPCDVEARFCSHCGADLPAEVGEQDGDVLDSLFDRITGERTDWLRRRRDEAPSIKKQEEKASQARLARMWADEADRREALARAMIERDRQARIMTYVIAGIIIAAIVLLVVVTSLVR